jgi:two-component system, OmpR family, sensor histidine kinase ChvG
MASAIDTATAESASPATHGLRPKVHLWPRSSGRRWPISPLTRRILAVNVLALALLAGGFLYLGKYQASLVGQQIESLKTQGEVFAAALGEGAVLDSVDEGEILLPDLARQMMRRLVEPTRARARLFDIKGEVIADSRVLRGPGDSVQVHQLPAPKAGSPIMRFADQVYDWIVDKLPSRTRFPEYRENASQRAGDYDEVMRALRGETGSAIRSDPAGGGLVLSVAVPVQRYKQVLGAIMLSTGSGEIEEEVRTVRLELLRIFGVALLVTVLLSFYLAGTIARPIRRLAAAAERARGRRARVEIPDFTLRGDEIGDLSGSLREMTDALWQRMSAIESFAADVAHEIKNPLSSLRSAVETAVRIEDPASQRRLMAVILDDVQRLDRLITDISDASRLDAELSRLELAPIDIAAMLEALVDIHQATRADDSPQLVLELADRGRGLVVPGIESRLSQVFLNLIANAVSFSPPLGEIRLTGRHDGRAVLVTVEDEGPGIPADKLTAIFDRFYTERPAGEKFGTHSGLGLSISKQIVEAHRGRIWAENRKDASGTVRGARFCIRLPAGS